jgi:hypothetical protein
VFALFKGIVKDEPIEQEYYWEKKGELKGVKKHVIILRLVPNLHIKPQKKRGTLPLLILSLEVPE